MKNDKVVGPRHFPLAGDVQLEEVAGGATLRRGARGSSVERFQQALVLAGQSLPRAGADGIWGGETTAALLRFQAANRLPSHGALDADTLEALDAAAARGLRFPDYAALHRDGVLSATVAVGYDEDGWHHQEVAELRRGLEARGFRPLDVGALSEPERARLHIDDLGGQWLSRPALGADGLTVVLRLVTPGPRARDEFSRGFERDEVVLYGGHGRYGSGPDFDDIHSSEGNYVIGEPASPGRVTIGPSSLARAQMTGSYQLQFFDGCNTIRYLDDLRAVPKNKGSANLDLMGTTSELFWSETAENLLAVLDGVISRKSVDEVRSTLEHLNRQGEGDRRQRFFADGLQDNRWRPGE